MRDMSDSEQEKRVTRKEASIICTQLETLEMAFLTVFWNTILVLKTMQRTSVAGTSGVAISWLRLQRQAY